MDAGDGVEYSCSNDGEDEVYKSRKVSSNRGSERGPRGGMHVIRGGEGKKWSKCREHFEVCYTFGGKKRSKCKHCGETYAYDPFSIGTKNLNDHINRKCKVLLSRRTGQDSRQNTLVLEKEQTLEGYGSNLSSFSHNEEECRRALAEMIIIDELPFRFVENHGFRRFCVAVCPRFEVPSWRTIVRDLYQLYVDDKAFLKRRIKDLKSRMSLTIDTWTSIQNIYYMVVTAHFVDDDWVLQKRILSFTQIGDLKGDSIGKCIENILLEWDIERVFTITVDNAIINTNAINYIIRMLNRWHVDGTILEGKYVHVRCSAHILNLIVSEGLKDLHDSIVGIRNAVKYVKSSPSRFERFRKCVELERIGSEGLLVLDVPSRWNSTYLMLESAMKLRKAFERMEEEDEHYVNYFCENENGKKRIGPPTLEDWENAKVFSKFLVTFYDVTLEFSASLTVTSNTYFVNWVVIYDQLMSLSVQNDPLISTMAISMKKKFDKYWGSLDTTNNLLMVASVLDPRYKFHYMQFRLETFFGVEVANAMCSKIRALLDMLYECYKSLNSNLNTFEGGPSSASFNIEMSLDDENIDLSRPAREALLWSKRQREAMVERNELELFLLEKCELVNDKFDLLAWWRNSCTKFPILSCIARDVFAMQVSTVASEFAFSTSGRILDQFRSSLTPKMVETLICTQNWLKASHSSDHSPLVPQVHASKYEDNCIENEEYYQKIIEEFEAMSSNGLSISFD